MKIIVIGANVFVPVAVLVAPILNVYVKDAAPLVVPAGATPNLNFAICESAGTLSVNAIYVGSAARTLAVVYI